MAILRAVNKQCFFRVTFWAARQFFILQRVRLGDFDNKLFKKNFVPPTDVGMLVRFRASKCGGP